WYKNGSALTNGGAISGAQTPTLTIASVTSSATYGVVITNGAGSVSSASAGLSVDGAPAIVNQPVSRTNLAGTLAGFSVSAIGNAPLTYRWQKNGTDISNGGDISGATTTLLSVGPVSNVDVGVYTAVVTNTV